MPKDKFGNELTWAEYISRWKKGIENVTPLQSTEIQVRSTWIVLIGIIGGITVSVFSIRTLWWLMIILIGALGNTIVQQLSLIQKRRILKQVEKEVYENDVIQR